MDVGASRTARADLRYSVRMLAANKTFSAMAILSLALGIGANTAIFSFMDALLMRSLPVPDPESLVTLAWHTNKREMHGSNRHDDSYTDPNGGFVGGIFAYPAFELLQHDTPSSRPCSVIKGRAISTSKSAVKHRSPLGSTSPETTSAVFACPRHPAD